MTLTPDVWMFAALAAVGGIGFILATRERPATVPVRPPLYPGRLVEVVCGNHAGLVGAVRFIALDSKTGQTFVTIRVQGGAFVECEPDELVPLNG